MILLRTEQRDLMPDILRHDDGDYLAKEINPLSPGEAEIEFLRRFVDVRETSTQPYAGRTA